MNLDQLNQLHGFCFTLAGLLGLVFIFGYTLFNLMMLIGTALEKSETDDSELAFGSYWFKTIKEEQDSLFGRFMMGFFYFPITLIASANWLIKKVGF